MGTGIDAEKVWVTSFNGKILVMDFNGRPIGKESDFPTAGKVGGLQAVATAANGDVWMYPFDEPRADIRAIPAYIRSHTWRARREESGRRESLDGNEVL